MLQPVRTVAPTETPVSLAQLKAHLRVDSSDEDALIQGLLDAAVDHLDGFSGMLGRALVTQTWTQDFGNFIDPCLPLAPVSAVSSVTYYDSNNAQQTLSASVYSVLNGPLGTYLALNYSQEWPILYFRDDAVRVTYVAGYGGADAVPARAKQAILLLAAHWYENRETVNIGSSTTPLPFTVDALIAPLRRVGM